jgi:hypothetical protein
MAFEGVVAALARGVECGLSLDYKWTTEGIVVRTYHLEMQELDGYSTGRFIPSSFSKFVFRRVPAPRR